MHAVPGAFDTKLLSLMTAAVDAAVHSAGHTRCSRGEELRATMARRVLAAAARGERDPLELMLVALSGIEVKAAGALKVPTHRPCSLPVTHRCSA
jgi:hypothetical protein